MIKHPNQVGRTAAALELLTKLTHHAVVTDNRIEVRTNSIGGLGGIIRQFDSEEAYMIWMLNQIKEAAETEIEWFETHPS